MFDFAVAGSASCMKKQKARRARPIIRSTFTHFQLSLRFPYVISHEAEKKRAVRAFHPNAFYLLSRSPRHPTRNARNLRW